MHFEFRPCLHYFHRALLLNFWFKAVLIQRCLRDCVRCSAWHYKVRRRNFRSLLHYFFKALWLDSDMTMFRHGTVQGIVLGFQSVSHWWKSSQISFHLVTVWPGEKYDTHLLWHGAVQGMVLWFQTGSRHVTWLPADRKYLLCLLAIVFLFL